MKEKKLLQYIGKFTQTAALSLFFLSAVSLTAFAENETPERLGSDQKPEISDMGHIPSGIDQQFYNYEGRSRRRTRSVLPQQFDLRQQALASPVKNQSPWGSCWAFGTLSAMESSVMVQASGSRSTNAEIPDYSERHLTWFSYQQQEGEGIISSKGQPFDVGGNRQIATGLLSSWAGVELESQVPYLTGKSQVWSVDKEKLYDSAGHLQNADFLPGTAVFDNYAAKSGYRLDRDAVNTIKKALMNNGAVDVSYYADQSRPDQTSVNGTYINNKTYAQYTDQYLTANHEVSIVGWDDDYSADNFLPNRRPPGNGAWIVKNSWGKNWGNEGCFYLSYYDQSVCEFTSFYLDLPDNEGNYRYDHNYQYDFLGMKSVYGILRYPQSKVMVANVFTAGAYETLKAVSAVTTEPGSEVRIQVYKNPEGDNPQSGMLVAEQTETVSYGGYHTLELEKPLLLQTGDQFSVVQLITGDKGSYVPLELASTSPVFGGEAFTNAKVEKGQSFWNQGNGWTDLAENPYKSNNVYSGNVMIKAFTVDNAVTARVKSVTVDSLDSRMQEIESGISAEVSDSQEVQITLPPASAFIRLHPVLEDQGEVEIQIDDQIYNGEDAIPRSAFEDKIVTVVGKGQSGSICYKYRFTVPDTVLTDNGVTLTDSRSYLPKGVNFSARVCEMEEGIYDEIRESLSRIGGRLFTVYAISTTADGNEISLSSDENVVLHFPKPLEYEEDRTRLFAVRVTEDHLLTEISDMEDGLQAPVNHIGNAYYVVAETKKSAQNPPAQAEIAELPDAVTDYSIVVKVVYGQEYSIDNGGNWKMAEQTEGGFSGLFEGLLPGTDYQVITRFAETEDTAASKPSVPLHVRTKNAPPQAPDAPAVLERLDRKITVQTVPGQEYAIKLSAEENYGEWQAEGIFEGLNPETEYDIIARICETDTAMASSAGNPAQARTKAEPPAAVEKPQLLYATDNSITVQARPGQEYILIDQVSGEEVIDVLSSAGDDALNAAANNPEDFINDGANWQESGIFTGLQPETEYLIFARKSGTETEMPGKVSEGLVAETMKVAPDAVSVPVVIKRTDISVEVETQPGQEYSIKVSGETEFAQWQDSGLFERLEPGTEYEIATRIAETGITVAGNTSEVLSLRTKDSAPQAPAAPEAARRLDHSIIVNTVPGQVYAITTESSINGDALIWQSSGIFERLEDQAWYYIFTKQAETDTVMESAVSEPLTVLTLQSSAEAPDVPQLKSAGSDFITIKEMSGQEYSINEGKNWQRGSTFSGLVPNRIYRVITRVFRTANKMESPVSQALDVRTDKRNAVAPAAPVSIGITETAVTIRTVNGLEYSIDGGKRWQNGGVFSGLKPNTNYRFHARSKENEIYKASPLSQVLSVTTKKISEFQVILNGNGGKTDRSSFKAKNGNRYGSLPTPKKSKYAFKGWYTAKTGGKKITSGSVVSLQKKQTLYAHWSKVSTARVSSIKLSNSKKRQLAVKIKDVKGAGGYQICYAENASFKKSRKSLNTTKTSKKISKLKKGRTYYVKVRAYKKDSCGKRIYGKYSKVKRIVIKK